MWVGESRKIPNKYTVHKYSRQIRAMLLKDKDFYDIPKSFKINGIEYIGFIEDGNIVCVNILEGNKGDIKRFMPICFHLFDLIRFIRE